MIVEKILCISHHVFCAVLSDLFWKYVCGEIGDIPIYFHLCNQGAEYYSNPWVKEVTHNYLGNNVPTKNDDVKPYRHIYFPVSKYRMI